MAEITGILGDIGHRYNYLLGEQHPVDLATICQRERGWCGSGNDIAERTGMVFFPDRGAEGVHSLPWLQEEGPEGVQSVHVDSAQPKVTVTGTADAAALVKKLNKSGKQAVDWHAALAKAPEAAPAPAAAEAQPAGDGGKDGGGAATTTTTARRGRTRHRRRRCRTRPTGGTPRAERTGRRDRGNL
ncbi:hypothetical protein ACP4OV_000391 [Aristida adscensionis]